MMCAMESKVISVAVQSAGLVACDVSGPVVMLMMEKCCPDRPVLKGHDDGHALPIMDGR